ncbi:MAG: hypothetical protein J6X72_03115, partial [Clostridia bacterium]|nr:hypothetical protein [Clostridia bacterium]
DGEAAVKCGLIDVIGGIREALAALREMAGVPTPPKKRRKTQADPHASKDPSAHRPTETRKRVFFRFPFVTRQVTKCDKGKCAR